MDTGGEESDRLVVGEGGGKENRDFFRVHRQVRERRIQCIRVPFQLEVAWLCTLAARCHDAGCHDDAVT